MGGNRQYNDWSPKWLFSKSCHDRDLSSAPSLTQAPSIEDALDAGFAVVSDMSSCLLEPLIRSSHVVRFRPTTSS